MGVYKHGGWKNNRRLYRTWANMRSRCNNKNHHLYKHYGGRGIKVCDEWNDFSLFREWAMDNGYQDNLSIDRIDFNGDYEPNNCRWANEKTQHNNTRRNTFIEFGGETHTLAEWAEIAGINYSTFCNRWVRGWSIERMINEPTHHHEMTGKYTG